MTTFMPETHHTTPLHSTHQNEASVLVFVFVSIRLLKQLE